MFDNPRLVNIGDIVWFGLRTETRGWGVFPAPAIVTRVVEPANMESRVVLHVFGWQHPQDSLTVASYSSTLAEHCWSWPSPPPAPEKGVTESNPEK
jgi:hypothetical protein